MNDVLTRAASPAEFKAAVFAINPEKAPRPDGLTALFYQKFWHILGPQVVLMVQDFMNSGRIDPSINEVNICLIRKSERPREMTAY